MALSGPVDPPLEIADEEPRRPSPLVTVALPIILSVVVVVGGLVLFAESLPSPSTEPTTPVCGPLESSPLGACPQSAPAGTATAAAPAATGTAGAPGATGTAAGTGGGPATPGR